MGIISAIGEGTMGSTGMFSPALGCSQQEGCFVLQPSALSAGNAAFLQWAKIHEGILSEQNRNRFALPSSAPGKNGILSHSGQSM